MLRRQEQHQLQNPELYPREPTAEEDVTMTSHLQEAGVTVTSGYDAVASAPFAVTPDTTLARVILLLAVGGFVTEWGQVMLLPKPDHVVIRLDVLKAYYQAFWKSNSSDEDILSALKCAGGVFPKASKLAQYTSAENQAHILCELEAAFATAKPKKRPKGKESLAFYTQLCRESRNAQTALNKYIVMLVPQLVRVLRHVLKQRPTALHCITYTQQDSFAVNINEAPFRTTWPKKTSQATFISVQSIGQASNPIPGLPWWTD